MGKSEGRRPLGRPKHRWEGNRKMCLKETGWGGVDWIDLSEDLVSWRAAEILCYSICKIYKSCIYIYI